MLDIHHEQAVRTLGRRPAAGKRGTSKLDGARGQDWIDRLAHGAHSATGEAEADDEFPLPEAF
jgi:hypothetical protein